MESHTCPGLSTQQSTQAWAPFGSGLQSWLLPFALGTWHKSLLLSITSSPSHMGLLVTAPQGPKKAAHGDSATGTWPSAGPRAFGGEGHPAQPRSLYQGEMTKVPVGGVEEAARDTRPPAPLRSPGERQRSATAAHCRDTCCLWCQPGHPGQTTRDTSLDPSSGQWPSVSFLITFVSCVLWWLPQTTQLLGTLWHPTRVRAKGTRTQGHEVWPQAGSPRTRLTICPESSCCPPAPAGTGRLGGLHRVPSSFQFLLRVRVRSFFSSSPPSSTLLSLVLTSYAVFTHFSFFFKNVFSL